MKCFEDISINLTIAEEQENGTELINLEEYFQLLRNESIDGYQREFLHSCEYFYFSIDDNHHHHHQREKKYWQILMKKLDREKLCPYDEKCELICKLYLKKEEIKLITLKISLNDIDDHQGRFLKKDLFI